MRISDWSSDVCSSDLTAIDLAPSCTRRPTTVLTWSAFTDVNSWPVASVLALISPRIRRSTSGGARSIFRSYRSYFRSFPISVTSEKPSVATSPVEHPCRSIRRSEEHTSELQSLMRISYAVFCLKKKKYKNTHYQIDIV